MSTIDDLLDFREWLGQRRDWLGFDLETEGLNVGRDRIRLFQVGDSTAGWALPWDWWSGAIRETIPHYRGRLVAHNAIFDTKFLRREGVDIPLDKLHDTQVMCHLNASGLATGLKPSARRLIGQWTTLGQTALNDAKSKQGWTWSTIPVDFPAYWQYGALDPVLTVMLAERLWPAIQDQRFIYDVELACISVLANAEIKGVRVDLDYTQSRLHHQMMVRDDHGQHLPGNPGSDKQMIDLLQRSGARLFVKTEKGQWSIDKDVLKYLETVQGIEPAGHLWRWRQADRLVTNYYGPFLVQNEGGILHPSTRVVGAKTGRMSITEPPLQTIPRGPEVRDAFIARTGQKLLLYDYEQLELRVMAHYAQEEAMLRAIHEGRDLHDFTADEIYGAGQWNREGRQTAKNAGFAKAYCSGVETFAATAGIEVTVAQRFMDEYDQTFPGIMRFQKEVIQQIITREQEENGPGWVKTIFGRKLQVPKDRRYAGVNYLIQSSATADLLKYKIVELANVGLADFIRLPIHDEIMFEAPEDIAPEVARTIEAVMPELQYFRCPMTIEGGTYDRWGDKYTQEGE